MDVKDVLAKYSKKIGNEMNSETKPDVSGVSRDYQKFKQELLPEFSRYEGWVKAFGKIIKLKVSAKDDKLIRKKLQTAHLEIEPGEVAGLAVMSFIILMFLGTLLTTGIWFLEGGGIGEFPVFFLFLLYL